MARYSVSSEGLGGIWYQGSQEQPAGLLKRFEEAKATSSKKSLEKRATLPGHFQGEPGRFEGQSKSVPGELRKRLGKAGTSL